MRRLDSDEFDERSLTQPARRKQGVSGMTRKTGQRWRAENGGIVSVRLAEV
jgi:hypothetical protein